MTSGSRVEKITTINFPGAEAWALRLLQVSQAKQTLPGSRDSKASDLRVTDSRSPYKQRTFYHDWNKPSQALPVSQAPRPAKAPRTDGRTVEGTTSGSNRFRFEPIPNSGMLDGQPLNCCIIALRDAARKEGVTKPFLTGTAQGIRKQLCTLFEFFSDEDERMKIANGLMTPKQFEEFSQTRVLTQDMLDKVRREIMKRDLSWSLVMLFIGHHFPDVANIGLWSRREDGVLQFQGFASHLNPKLPTLNVTHRGAIEAGHYEAIVVIPEDRDRLLLDFQGCADCYRIMDFRAILGIGCFVSGWKFDDASFIVEIENEDKTTFTVSRDHEIALLLESGVGVKSTCHHFHRTVDTPHYGKDSAPSGLIQTLIQVMRHELDAHNPRNPW